MEYFAENLLAKVSKLSSITDRREATRELAQYLGVDDLIIFILDGDINTLLPAPGFPQTLPEGRMWQRFLSVCAKTGRHSVALIPPGRTEPVSAYGIAAEDGSILVLLGGTPKEELVNIVLQLLPLLAAAFRGELAALNEASQARLAKMAAEQSHQLIKSLDEARRELQQTLQMRDQFLSIAAHELKTPLTSILGFTQILFRRAEKEKLLGERDLQLVKIVINQANRMQRLMEEFFNQDRVRAGLFELEIAQMDLAVLVRETVEELQPSLDKHSLRYYSDGGESLPLRGDKVRLHLVVQNLLHNAIKYSPNGGEVVIRTWQENEKNYLSVSDSGIGIPSTEHSHLYERFYRASNAQKNHLGGMGIGLFLAKEIISGHGGNIKVESIEGQGSTFTICLPVQNRKPLSP